MRMFLRKPNSYVTDETEHDSAMLQADDRIIFFCCFGVRGFLSLMQVVADAESHATFISNCAYK